MAKEAEQEAEIIKQKKLLEVKEKFISKGIPLIIGEFGCVASADDATRAEYYRYYISDAKKNGFPCFVWDNGQLSGKDGYGLLDRTTLEWNQTIINGIMSGAE